MTAQDLMDAAILRIEEAQHLAAEVAQMDVLALKDILWDADESAYFYRFLAETALRELGEDI